MSVVEGLNPIRDGVRAHEVPEEQRKNWKWIEGSTREEIARLFGPPGSFDDIARHGIKEELGLADVADIVDLRLLTCGIDLGYMQVNFLGYAHLRQPLATVRESHRLHADKEFRMTGVPADPRSVATWLREALTTGFTFVGDEDPSTDLRFWSCGWATVYYGLCAHAGIQATDSAFAEVLQAWQPPGGVPRIEGLWERKRTSCPDM